MADGNGQITLSLHADGETIVVETDYDSHILEDAWITVWGDPAGQDFYYNMTFQEAAQFRDRLSYLLEVWENGQR